jgi:Bacterial SH3 domain
MDGPDHKTMYVQKRANLRSRPSTRSRIIATVSPRTKLIVTGKEGKWYAVNYRRRPAFIAAFLLGRSPPRIWPGHKRDGTKKMLNKKISVE